MYVSYSRLIENPIYQHKMKLYNNLQSELGDLEEIKSKVEQEKRDAVRKSKREQKRLDNLVVKPAKNINEKRLAMFLEQHHVTKTDKKQRYTLWYHYYGTNKIGNCFCCMCTLNLDDPAWHRGHVLSDYDGGEKSLENLRPICAKCNLAMKQQHMYRYMIYNETNGCRNLSKGIKASYEPELKMYRRIEEQVFEITNNSSIRSNKKVIEWFSRQSRSQDLSVMKLLHQTLTKFPDIRKGITANSRYIRMIASLHQQKIMTKEVRPWMEKRSRDSRIKELVEGLYSLVT